ncbi:MAG: SRPBCC domain-containing protein [Bacteroidota bacterium]
MSTLRFDQFTKKIYINAAVEELYRYWATTHGITSWFLREAVYKDPKGLAREADDLIQTGDSYVWEWHNWEGQEKGKILQANDTDFLEISFANSKVAIQLEDAGKATLVILKQHSIPLDEESKLSIHYGCSNGWTFWLANLKAYVEHGILLNETKFDLTKIPLAGYEFVNM